MKKILLLGTLVIGSVLLNKASAQVDVNANIGIQPEWGPSGYDNAEYYYLPDIETYYCVPTREFTWFENGQWVTSPYLPECYANYDLYGGYKVVLNERNPWFHFNEHRRLYASYRYRHDQVVIRDFRARGGYYGGNYGRANYGYNGYGRVDYGHANYGRPDNRGYENRREDFNRGRVEEHARVENFNRGQSFDRGQHFEGGRNMDRGGHDFQRGGQERGGQGRGESHGGEHGRR